MAENKLRTATKKQQAYIKIKNMIIENDIPKNTPLVERQLCELIGISRTPIREALRELANEGLVELIEGKGVYVKRMEFRDMVELFELREALECMAVRLFIERMDEKNFAEISFHLSEQEAAYARGDHKAFMDEDMAIHRLIAEGSQNRKLKEHIVQIYDQIRQIAISSKDDEEMRNAAMKDHREIIGAIQKKDISGAQEAVAKHIKDTLEKHKQQYYLFD